MDEMTAPLAPPAPEPAPKKPAPKAAAAPPPHKTPEQRQRERDRNRGYTEEKNAQGVVSYIALSDGFSTVSEETMEAYLAEQG